MKKTHYIYTFLSFILLICVSVGTYFSYKKILSVKEDIAQKQSEWQIEENRRNEIKNLERSVKNLAEEKKDLDSHFVASDDPVAFLNSLESMALSVGAVAEVSTVGTNNNAGLVVNLRATGGFDSLYKFLTLIENSHYIMEIQNMAMSTNVPEIKSTNVSKWDMSVQLKLTTFSNI